MKHLSILFALLLLSVAVFGQRELGVRPTATGGPLRFEQAVFDVQSYDRHGQCRSGGKKRSPERR